MANMWWEPLDFEIQVPGRWRCSIDTTEPTGFVEPFESATAGPTVRVQGRSIIVLVPDD